MECCIRSLNISNTSITKSNKHGHLCPVRWIYGVLYQVLEHQQHLHHKVQQVLSSCLILWSEVLDVLTKMLGGHQSEQGHHIGHHRRGIPIILIPVGNSLYNCSEQHHHQGAHVLPCGVKHGPVEEAV